MGGKLIETRFTIQFSSADPAHLQAAAILNRQGRRSKAQYLVNAIIHYENCSETTNTQRISELDEKVIEAVVNRILLDRGGQGMGIAPPASQIEDISFDDAIDTIGAEGFNAVANTLKMFRKGGC